MSAMKAWRVSLADGQSWRRIEANAWHVRQGHLYLEPKMGVFAPGMWTACVPFVNETPGPLVPPSSVRPESSAA